MHAPETRAQAEALLMGGSAPHQVAETLGLPLRTVKHWAAALGERMPLIATKKEPADADLILTYLRTGLRAMIVQAEVFADPVYCRAQTAADLAIAHGVLGDKLAGVAATAQAMGLLTPAQSFDALPAGEFDSP